MQKIDLSGQKFGRLTVIKDSGRRVNKKVMWLCQCECGNQVEVSGDNLKSGNTQSCGCYRREKHGNDFLGKRFGKLTVIEKTEERSHRGIIWLCRCDCGCFTKVSSNALQKGTTTSCGCQNLSNSALLIQNWLLQNNISFEKEYSFEDLRGLKNGKLRFDFAIFDEKENLLFLIEFQGEQHFRYKENFMVPKEHDEAKIKYCKNNNIELLLINFDENPIEKIGNFLEEKFDFSSKV